MRSLVHDSYMIVNNVVYLVIAEKSYPRKLAFSYLDELSKEFEQSYGAKVEAVRKPYAFVGFGECAIFCCCCEATTHTMTNRHVHVEDNAPVPRFADGQCCIFTYGQVERRSAGRDANHDEEYGGAALERRFTRP